MQARLTVVAAAALLAASCGGKGEGEVSANADTGLTAESIATNDVTAIDAVTGEAANMAADMDFTNLPEGSTGPADNRSAASKPSAGSKPRLESPSAPPQPVENRAEPATAPANSTK